MLSILVCFKHCRCANILSIIDLYNKKCYNISTMRKQNKIDISDFVNIETIQTITQNLIERFKLRRKEFGLTQRTLSRVSDVSYASIRRFETTGDISLASLFKLSDALGLLSEFNMLFSKPVIKDIRRIK